MKKLTTDSFIQKAIDNHNGIYSYNKTIYVKSNIPVIITCLIHGDFSQQPNNHLFGNGCPKCRDVVFGNLRRSNTAQFIEKAKKLHQNKFDYSKTVYRRWDVDVIIICAIHGEFKQRPNNHLNGAGCPICAEYIRREKYCHRRLSHKEFVKRSAKIHNNKYSYKTEYVNSKTAVTITCPVHGDFEQLPFGHLCGRGCRKCGFIIDEPRKKVTTEEFIIKARKIHDMTYSYEKFVYTDNNTKSIIICPKHGDFSQAGGPHLSGSGCPRCKESRGEKIIFRLLQQLDINFQRQYKIDNCKNKYRLPFDFAIFSKGKLCGLIEFQGEQHFKPIKCWGGIKTLEYVQNNDRIKKEYCKTRNIPLAIILYKENIHERISEFINLVIPT